RHLAVHLGQDRVATAEGDQRELGEHDRQRRQCRVHIPILLVSTMLIGARTSMMGTSGHCRKAIAIRQMTAMPIAIGRRRNGRAILIAKETSRPAAAAARPANM